MKKFPLWLASTIITLGIFVPTKVHSQEVNTVSVPSNDTSILARHYRYRRYRYKPVRYRRHGVYRRRHYKVYSPHRVYSPHHHRRSRFSRHRYRGRRTGSFGIFIRL